MDDETRIEFSDSGAYFGLMLLDRPFADAESDWDRDTVRAHVVMEADGLHGEFDVFTSSHELAHLRHVLRGIYEGVGTPQERLFRLLDANIWLTFKLGKRGDIELAVESRRGVVGAESQLYYTI